MRLFTIELGFHTWDTSMYLYHARAFWDLQPTTWTRYHFRPPLLFVILIGIYGIIDSIVAAHVFIAALSTLTLGATYVFARRFFSPVAALFAVLAVFLSPEHIEKSHEILVDAWLPLWWVLAALFADRALREGSQVAALLSGLFIGIAVLTKFTSLALLGGIGLVVVCFHFWFVERGTLFDRGRAMLTDPTGYLILLGTLVAISPYLYWGWTSFGSPFYMFEFAFGASGAPDPWYRYLARANWLLTMPFLLLLPAGVSVFFVTNRSKQFRWGLLVAGVLSLVLLIPMQAIKNHEVRYLLPVLPFLGMIAAAGLDELTRRLGGPAVVVGVIGLLLLSTPGVVTTQHLDTALTGEITNNRIEPEMTASQDIRDMSSPEAQVYVNHDWPFVTYYSERRVWHSRNLDTMLQSSSGELWDHSAYIYYTERRDFSQETLSRLYQNQYVSHITTYDGSIHVFQYNPPSESEIDSVSWPQCGHRSP
jgi:hypothetical protein